MPRVISGMRQAIVFGTPNGAANVETAMDFQLGPREGIQIHDVHPFGDFSDNSPAPSDTVPVTQVAVQSLHLDTGNLEAVPAEAADDTFVLDTEIFFVQTVAMMFMVGTTNTFGAGGSVAYNPSGPVHYNKPILVARNITHRVETFATGQLANLGCLVFYEYVEFNTQELGFILARRN